MALIGTLQDTIPYALLALNDSLRDFIGNQLEDTMMNCNFGPEACGTKKYYDNISKY